MKKLTLKEENEFVTKGFLVRYLDEVLEEKLEEKLDKKLEEKLEQKFNEKFALWREEMARHVSTLVERSDEKFRIMTEGFFDHQERIVTIEEHVGLK